MRLIYLIIVLLVPNSVGAHPSDDWVAQSRVLALWSQAVTEFNGALVDELTADGHTPYPSEGNTRIDMTRAIFSEKDGKVIAEPVILVVDNGSFLIPRRVTLIRQGSKWRISNVVPSSLRPDHPLALLPELAATAPISFRIVETATGLPVYSRVSIIGPDGEYWPPRGHQKNIRTGWREDVGGDVFIDGQTFAYVPPEFVADLPLTGEFTIVVRKGIEYLPARHSFRTNTKKHSVQVEIPRWIDMRAEGWYAGDNHTHFLSEQSALIELRAEDLSLVNILATKWGESITDVDRFRGAPSPYSTHTEIVVINQEMRHHWLGHTILHDISELVHPLTWGGPSEGVRGGYDYPPMALQADRAHAQGGLVTWAHFPNPGGELAVDIGLGKIDTIDLFTWGDPFAAGPMLADGTRQSSAIDMWYLFLNTGSRLPATAGTDKMLNAQVTGSVRTWVKSEGSFSYKNWLAALRTGRTMVSTGPVVNLNVEGVGPGAVLQYDSGAIVKVEATLRAPFQVYPVEVLEIVHNGTVVATAFNKDERSILSVEAAIEVTGSGWIAARARGSSLLPYQVWSLLGTSGIPPVAHTSPVYLEVDGKPIWHEDAARKLERQVDRAVEWTTSNGRYQTEQQRQEVLELYQKAKAHFATKP